MMKGWVSVDLIGTLRQRDDDGMTTAVAEYMAVLEPGIIRIGGREGFMRL